MQVAPVGHLKFNISIVLNFHEEYSLPKSY